MGYEFYSKTSNWPFHLIVVASLRALKTTKAMPAVG